MTWNPPLAHLALLCLLLIATHLEKSSAAVSARRPLRGGMRRSQNSRTRFQQRINRLGMSGKMDLIRSGKVGRSKALPSGFVLLAGRVMDSTNKLIQKQAQTGTVYFSFGDSLGRQPLFVRPGNELGWHFVVFQDPFYWRGSGHLIMLRKVLGVTPARSQMQFDTLYEAYTLSLRVSLHPRVYIRDPAFRQKLAKRRRKYENVKQRRPNAYKVPHLRDRAGKLGKRKKRNVFSFDMGSLPSGGDCILTPLNVTRVLQRIMQSQRDKNNRTVQTTLLHSGLL